MKFVSLIMLSLGVGAGLVSAVLAPSVQEKSEANTNNQVVQIPAVKIQPASQSQEFNGAIRVIAPQKDLESAVRMSEKGDILVLGPEGWYRLEGKTLQQGTKVYILGQQGSMVSVFPKEAETVR